MSRKHFKRLFCRQYEKKTGLSGYVYNFSVDYDAIEVAGILDIDKYLMEKNGIV